MLENILSNHLWPVSNTQTCLCLLSISLMSGLAALDAKCSSRLGLITVSYYLWTTFLAVVVGIVMVLVIHPGGMAQKEDSEDSGKPIMSSADALLDLIRSDGPHHPPIDTRNESYKQTYYS